MRLKRVYRKYTEWEEVAHNMWGKVPDKKEWIVKAVEFTSDHVLYGSFMIKVVRGWPVSCENALTDYSLNRRAWIGHAATALAIHCPEDITRLAWGRLTDEQRFMANKQADRAIRSWENDYIESKNIREGVGGSLLF
tara:strand:- start:1108 stop:1518 length:411 start_codon:yes stop_codon:yes gene_type:complete